MSHSPSLSNFSQALARDNFHCVVTGAIDYVAYHNNKQLTVEALAQELQVFHTEAVHIFPAFTNKGEDNLKVCHFWLCKHTLLNPFCI